MTATGQKYQPSIRESVANLHERVSSVRDNAYLYMLGVDKTQSIALDEIFGKAKDQATRYVSAVSRYTKNYRKTVRTSSVAVK